MSTTRSGGAGVIPTLLLPALLIGRWWLVPAAAVIWPTLLILTGVGSGFEFALSAGALAAANVTVAVCLHMVVVWLFHAARRSARHGRDKRRGDR